MEKVTYFPDTITKSKAAKWKATKSGLWVRVVVLKITAAYLDALWMLLVEKERGEGSVLKTLRLAVKH